MQSATPVAHRRRPATLTAFLATAALLAIVGWRAATDSVDFPIYHHAGSQVLSGDFELYPQALYDGQTDVGGHGFRYAPAVAFLFVPFALLPLQPAAFLFFLLKVAALVHLTVILGRRLGVSGHYGRLALAAVLTTGGYLLEELRGGNLQLVIVYFMVLAFDLAERGKVVLPGLTLAVSIAAKVTPLAVLAYLLLRGKLGAAAVTLVTLVVLVIAPAAVWGGAQNRHLLDGFSRYSATTMDSPLTARNYSVRGALLKYRPDGLSAESASAVWMGLMCLTGVAVAAMTVRRNSFPFRRELEVSLVLTCIPLLSPHSQRIYFVALYVPVVVLVVLLQRQLLPERLRTAAIVGLVVTAAAGTVLPAVLASKNLSRGYLDLSPYTIATVILAGAVAYITVRAGAAPLPVQHRQEDRN